MWTSALSVCSSSAADFDGDRLGERADFERHVDAAHLTDADRHVLAHDLAEPLQRRLDVVEAWQHVGSPGARVVFFGGWPGKMPSGSRNGDGDKAYGE